MGYSLHLMFNEQWSTFFSRKNSGIECFHLFDVTISRESLYALSVSAYLFGLGFDLTIERSQDAHE
jgi:hypothetical protein